MLSTDDLTNRAFTTTRLREGYEIAEVEAFVDDVRETLAQRDRELRELRQQLAAAGYVPGDGDAVRGSSVAAARLLEMATVNADQLITEAKAEAGSLLAAANADADQVASAAERHRESVLAEVAGRKASLESRIEGLTRLESENRERLRGWFTDLLAQVQGEAAVDGVALAE